MAIDETSVRIHLPQALLERVRTYQVEKGIASFAAAVVEVLEQFFAAVDAPAYAPLDRLEALETEVKTLTYQLALLNQQFNQQLISQQIIGQQLGGRSLPLTPSVAPMEQPTAPPAQTGYFYRREPVSYEDIEDEPDEILWDFLPPEERI